MSQLQDLLSKASLAIAIFLKNFIYRAVCKICNILYVPLAWYLNNIWRNCLLRKSVSKQETESRSLKYEVIKGIWHLTLRRSFYFSLSRSFALSVLYKCWDTETSASRAWWFAKVWSIRYWFSYFFSSSRLGGSHRKSAWEKIRKHIE